MDFSLASLAVEVTPTLIFDSSALFCLVEILTDDSPHLAQVFTSTKFLEKKVFLDFPQHNNFPPTS